MPLDEAGKAGRNPLVEMLARNAQSLPDWLGLVVTSRPEFDVIGLKPKAHIQLSLISNFIPCVHQLRTGIRQYPSLLFDKALPKRSSFRVYYPVSIFIGWYPTLLSG